MLVFVRIQVFTEISTLRYLLGIKYFNHKSGCQKCSTIGVWSSVSHTTCFPEFNAPGRTDFSFRNRLDPDHHKEKSVLEDLMDVEGKPLLDMIKQFPTSDTLHLLHEGAIKKCVMMWKNGTREKKQKKWSKEVIASLNRNILELNRELPSDIHRKIRIFEYVSYFKATEFRALLLYVGMVIFKDVLSETEYTHFMYLCTSARFLSCQTYVANAEFKSNAKKYLSDYCKYFVIIYGASAVVSNIHYISHIFEDVDQFGSLETISTYPFENFLREIKMNVQASNTTLEQISRRLVEVVGTDKHQVDLERRKYEKASWVPELKYVIKEPAFKFIRLSPNVFLSVRKTGDKWFLTKFNDIVSMKYATRLGDSYFIRGQPIGQKTNFFTLPFSSHITNIYLSDGKLLNEKTYKHDQVKAKLVCLSYQDKFVFIPLLHSIDELNGIWS